MTTAIAFLVFIGFFAAYATSKRTAVPEKTSVEKFLRNNISGGRVLSLLILATALVLLIVDNGTLAGTFIFFILLMLLGSFIVLLAPLRIVTPITGAIAFVLFLCVELLILV